MDHANDYRGYLASPRWRWLRELVQMRAKGRCELCGNSAPTQIHHVRYPKRFTGDHPDNLLALCESCHTKQHGIRVQRMNNSLLDSAQRIDFTFNGDDGRSYTFKFRLVSGRPWAPIIEIEKALYNEQQKFSGTFHRTPDSPRALSRDGNVLAQYASAVLDQEYRAVGEDGDTWIRASGVFQVLCSRNEPVCQSFRRQLGDFLESFVVNEQTAPKRRGLSPGTGNSYADLAMNLSHQAEAVAHAILEAEAAKQLADATSKRVDEVVSRLDEMTGSKFFITAQLACAKMNVNPSAIYRGKQTVSQVFGAYATKWERERGLAQAPKVEHGGFMVNQYCLEAARATAVALDLKNFGKKKEEPELPGISNYARLETAEDFRRVIDSCNLGGMAKQLANHCAFLGFSNGRVVLDLDPAHEQLRSAFVEERLIKALSETVGEPLRLEIQVERKSA